MKIVLLLIIKLLVRLALPPQHCAELVFGCKYSRTIDIKQVYKLAKTSQPKKKHLTKTSRRKLTNRTKESVKLAKYHDFTDISPHKTTRKHTSLCHFCTIITLINKKNMS